MQLLPWTIDLLESSCELWNQEIGNDFPMRLSLLEQNTFGDPNLFHGGSCIAWDDEKQRVAGFVVSKCWDEHIHDIDLAKGRGWIQVLLVASGYRGQGIGSQLLDYAEKALQQKGVTQVLLGKDPWHFFPGIPKPYTEVQEWFRKRGYIQGGEVYDLYRREDPAKTHRVLPQSDGVEYRLARLGDKERFISFLHRCFPGRWEYEAIHYFHRGGTGREFVVAVKDGNIIGFCRINDAQSPYIAQNVYWAPLFKEELGGAGPLGIDPQERKKGYGLAIVEAGCCFLQQRKITHIVIDWTGLSDFYGKLGFDIWKTYVEYSKNV